MHEFALMKDLVKKIESIAKENNSDKVTKISVKLGALSHMSSKHFKEHFLPISTGTIYENAELDIEEDSDINAPDAQNILLKSIDII
jgi:hydrogenase nickel incorporation protein HypA/HybF